MKKTHSDTQVVAAEEIAQLAENGKSVSRFFTGKGRMMQPLQSQGQIPVQRVNVDFAAPMLKELDDASQEMNISRQALIKTLVRQALDQRSLARHAAQLSRQR
jgi:hypothetical protein